MAHQDYIDAGNDLLEELEEYGVDVDIIEKQKVTGASRNDVTYDDVDIGTIKVLFTSVEQQLLDSSTKSESYIDASDKDCIAGNSLDLKKSYKVKSSSITYEIIKIIEIKPADYLIGYRLYLKGVE